MPELKNEFNKIVGLTINIQKSVVFLYNNKKNWKEQIKKTIPLQMFPYYKSSYRKNKIKTIKVYS